MFLIETVYTCFLFICCLYAFLLGGATGRAGAIIFLIGSLLSYFAIASAPDWQYTNFQLLLIDSVCFIALLLLAMVSDRYWPIWAAALQFTTLIIHFATIWADFITPVAYQTVATLMALPALAVMAEGTRRDWAFKNDRNS